MTVWIGEMRKKIRSLPGNCERRAGWSIAIGTAFQRLGYATYHRAEAIQLLESKSSAVPTDNTLAQYFQSTGCEKFEPNMTAAWIGSSHLIAAAESLYAACELMAPIALWSCVRGQHSEVILRNLTLDKIAPQLPKQAQADMRTFLKLQPFKHLRAFTIVSKHQDLTAPKIGWEPGGDANSLSISAFTYNTKPPEQYNRIGAKTFLEVNYSEIVSNLNRIGESLVAKMF